MTYEEAVRRLQKGDQIIFYTDGITEAHDPSGQLFGTARLDEVLEQCSLEAAALFADRCSRLRNLPLAEQFSTIER